METMELLAQVLTLTASAEMVEMVVLAVVVVEVVAG
jgi:hypothetical protein